jgi:hypothetical protein
MTPRTGSNQKLMSGIGLVSMGPGAELDEDKPFVDRLDHYAAIDSTPRNLWGFLDEARYLTPMIQILGNVSTVAAAQVRDHRAG